MEKWHSSIKQSGQHRFLSEGTGLGLTISQKIVQLMDSQIEVESTPEKGSQFSFELSLQTKDLELSDSKPKDIIGYEGPVKRVLVIDDVLENRSFLVDLLVSLGFDVEEAVNGFDGFEKIKSFLPDIVLSDLLMPVIDGFEFLKILKSHDNFKDIKVVAISAKSTEPTVEIWETLGFEDYISKPFQLERLFSVMQKLLGIQWVYQESDNATPDEPDLFHVPDQDVLGGLVELAEDGDFMEFKSQLNLIQDDNEMYKPFVNKLMNMAESFQDQAICDFIGELQL